MEIQNFKHHILKAFVLFFSCMLFYSNANGQANIDWYKFRDKKTNLLGYKNAQGQVKIQAKFGGLTDALVFRNIIAVDDEKTEKSYYLLKNGDKIGLDSLYIWDNSFDHENENKIRFRDKKTDKVGFFNTDGKIIIPALYNDAQPFHNGLALVIHDAKRKCSNGSPYNEDAPCENWYWDGVSALIDSNNRVVANNININQTENIDWFSARITNSIPDTTLYTSFETPSGEFYSFLNYKKEFKTWFYKNYLRSLNYQILAAKCYKELTVEGHFKNKVRLYYSKAFFLDQYRILLLEKMKDIKANTVKTIIFGEDINQYIYKGKKFPAFYTVDGEPDKQKHPLFNVVSTYYKKNKQLDHQDQFFFIRTNGGYELIGIALGIGEL